MHARVRNTQCSLCTLVLMEVLCFVRQTYPAFFPLHAGNGIWVVSSARGDEECHALLHVSLHMNTSGLNENPIAGHACVLRS